MYNTTAWLLGTSGKISTMILWSRAAQSHPRSTTNFVFTSLGILSPWHPYSSNRVRAFEEEIENTGNSPFEIISSKRESSLMLDFDFSNRHSNF